MPQNTPNTDQIEQLKSFMENTHIPSLNRSLRNIMLEYMANKNSYDSSREYFVSDMIYLFALLDALEA